MLTSRRVRLRTVREISSGFRKVATGLIAATIAACGGGSDPVVSVSSVSVTPTTSTIALGGTVQLAAATLDANGAVLSGRPVTWSTSNAGVATVSAGLVTGISAGDVLITASSEGKSGSATAKVAPPPVATVTVSPANPSLTEGDTLRLSAQLRGADDAILTGRTVTWNSATTSVASISSTGLITAVSAGTSVITATSEGKTGSVTVTVARSACNVTLAKSIISGTPIIGTLEAGDCPWVEDTYADIYTFTLATSMAVDVRLSSTVFDTYLYIISRSPSGQLVIVAENDDESEGATNSRLTRTLAAGTHYIMANSWEAATGDYTLTLTAPYTPAIAMPSSIVFPAPAIRLERAAASDIQQLRALMHRRQR